jgi:hypothetical protein
MLVPPAGWRSQYGIQLTTFLPPEHGGRHRYYERLPLRGLKATLADILARDARFRVDAIGRCHRIVTHEGEHAAWVPIRGWRDAGPAARFVGVVFGDDFTAALDTLVVVRDRLPFYERGSRELLLEISLGLGARRRRYGYRPPDSFQPVPAGLATTWYPPDFPANRASITVLPATPSSDAPHTVFDALLARDRAGGFEVEGAVDERTIGTPKLEGFQFSFHGRYPGEQRASRDVVVLAANGYRHTLHHESWTSDHLLSNRRAFFDLVRSVEAVPAPAHRSPDFTTPASTAAITAMWAD